MKNHVWTIIYTIVLISFTTYISLDTFVIAKTYNSNATEMNTEMFSGVDQTLDTDKEADSGEESSEASTKSSEHHSHQGFGKHERPDFEGTDGSTTNPTTYSGETTYKDSNVSVEIKQYTEYDTQIYVADVTLSSTQYLKTAFANDTYGKNITETTSSIAEANNAILAINGDYYGVQESGYVIRNGVVYRDTANGSDVLCIYASGTMEIVNDSECTAEELVEKGVWQALTFGPALIEEGEIAVSTDSKVDKELRSNPRTAIGIIDANHYVFVVSDGRTSASEGLSLYEIATFMEKLGVKTAYNLDGGGSSTMYFNGQVVNNPTTGGRIKEREVSDIVYVS